MYSYNLIIEIAATTWFYSGSFLKKQRSQRFQFCSWKRNLIPKN